MANTPKSKEEKRLRILNAWQTLAPTKSFGGMTLTEFQAVAAPARKTISDLEDQMTHAINVAGRRR